MDWQKELEARLADDPRLERKESRLGSGSAFFYRGKEIVHLTAPSFVNIRMSAGMLFTLQAFTAEDCVIEVSKDGIVVRLESLNDVELTQKILERLFKEKPGERRPEGKNTRKGGWSAKRKANGALEDALALRSLEKLTLRLHN
ncbi:MAG: hypothetical protein EOP11_12130 [Proteobacteria bacterium]|nr:MAG: hypothetical protein EOP11_12130 [Pseudomonadota bacterium]